MGFSASPTRARDAQKVEETASRGILSFGWQLLRRANELIQTKCQLSAYRPTDLHFLGRATLRWPSRWAVAVGGDAASASCAAARPTHERLSLNAAPMPRAS